MVGSREARSGIYCLVLAVALSAVTITLLLGLVKSSDGQTSLLKLRFQQNYIYDTFEQHAPEMVRNSVLQPVRRSWEALLSQLLRFALGHDPRRPFELLRHSEPPDLMQLSAEQYILFKDSSRNRVSTLASRGTFRPRANHLESIDVADPFIARSPTIRVAVNKMLQQIISSGNTSSEVLLESAVEIDAVGAQHIFSPPNSSSPLATGSYMKEARTALFPTPERKANVSEGCIYERFAMTCNRSAHEQTLGLAAIKGARMKELWRRASSRVLNHTMAVITGRYMSQSDADTILQYLPAVPHSGIAGGLLPPVSRLRLDVNERAQQAREHAALLVSRALGPAIRQALQEADAARSVAGRPPPQVASASAPDSHKRQPASTSLQEPGDQAAWLTRKEARALVPLGLSQGVVAQVIADQVLRSALLIGAPTCVHGLRLLEGCSSCGAAGSSRALALDMALEGLRQYPAVVARHWEVVKQVSGSDLGVEGAAPLAPGAVLIVPMYGESTARNAVEYETSAGASICEREAVDKVDRTMTVHGSLGEVNHSTELLLTRAAIGAAISMIEATAIETESRRRQKSVGMRDSAAGVKLAENEFAATRLDSATRPVGLVGAAESESDSVRTRAAFLAWLLTVLVLCACMVYFSLHTGAAVTTVREFCLRMPVVRWYVVYLLAQVGLSLGFMLSLEPLKHACMTAAGAAYLLIGSEIDCAVMEGGERKGVKTDGRGISQSLAGGSESAEFVRRGSNAVSQHLLRKVGVILACVLAVAAQLAVGQLTTAEGELNSWIMLSASNWYTPCASAGMYALLVFAMRPSAPEHEGHSDGQQLAVEGQVRSSSGSGYLEPRTQSRLVEWLGVFSGVMGVANLFWPRLLPTTGWFYLASRVSDCLLYLPLIVPTILQMDSYCAAVHGMAGRKSDQCPVERVLAVEFGALAVVAAACGGLGWLLL